MRQGGPSAERIGGQGKPRALKSSFSEGSRVAVGRHPPDRAPDCSTEARLPDEQPAFFVSSAYFMKSYKLDSAHQGTLE